MIPVHLMHNRIYRLAKIEFASFVDASFSRGSLHIVRRPLKLMFQSLYVKTVASQQRMSEGIIFGSASDIPQSNNTLFLVNSTLL